MGPRNIYCCARTAPTAAAYTGRAVLVVALVVLLLSFTGPAVTAASKPSSSGSRPLYSNKSAVKVLSGTEFTNTIKNGKQVTLVEFFAPWCGHCKNFAPELEKAAEALAGIVNVVAVEDSEIMMSESVKGFPTVKLYFGKNATEQSATFSGQRTAEAVVSFVIDQLSNTLRRRAGIQNAKEKSAGSSDDDVIELHDGNFDKMVLADDTNVWFVEFYAPWCGHCQSLAPIWAKLAGNLNGKVKVAKIDATTNPIKANDYEIKSFPTLKLFPAGKKTKHSVVDYGEARDLESLAKFAMGFASMSMKAEQLLSEEMFRTACTNQLCIITFLPDILDSRATGRNALLEQLNDAVKAASMMPVRFFWTQGGDNIKFEEQLHLQFGYPAVVAAHLGKQKFAVSRGSFSTPSLRNFLTALMAGKEPLMDIPQNLESIKEVEPWDGKDAELPVQEETTLDDEL